MRLGLGGDLDLERRSGCSIALFLSFVSFPPVVCKGFGSDDLEEPPTLLLNTEDDDDDDEDLLLRGAGSD